MICRKVRNKHYKQTDRPFKKVLIFRYRQTLHHNIYIIIITEINILPHYLDQDKRQQWGGVGRTWARLELCDKGSR